MSPHPEICTSLAIVFSHVRAKKTLQRDGDMKRYIKRIFYTIAVILLGLFIFQLFEYQTFKQKTETQAVTKATETTAAFKKEIEGLLSRVNIEAKTLGVRLWP